MLLLSCLSSIISLIFFSPVTPAQCLELSTTTTEASPEGILGSPCKFDNYENSCEPQSFYFCKYQHRQDIYSKRYDQCVCHEEKYFAYWRNKTCLLKATRVGDPCQVDGQCTSGGLGPASKCSADGGRCACYHDKFSNEDGTKCLTPPGTNCQHSSDCFGAPELSSCYMEMENKWYGEAKCKCRDGIAVLNSNKDECLPARHKLGETCQEQVQCFPGHTSQQRYDCLNSSCSCVSNATHEPNQDECYIKARYVGQECEVDVQCQANLGLASTCSSLHSQSYNICTCAHGSVPINNFTSCGSFGPVPIGWPCDMNQTCSGKEGTSLCTPAGMCQCEQGYIASRLLDDCLPIRNSLGGDCLESQQCAGENRECGGGSAGGNICKCISGWVQPPRVDDKCYRIASGVGDSCERHIQCVAGVGSSQCVNNRCRCVAGAKEAEWKMVPKMRRCIVV